MPFERPTIETIYSRIKADMESRVTGGVKIPRFSLLGILALVFAGAVHLLYGYLVWLTKQLFVTTADEWYLVNVHALKYNLPRKAASYASGVVLLEGTVGTVVPEGTLLQDSNGSEYSTTEEATLDSGGQYFAPVQAVEAGSTGNTLDTVLYLASPLAGVSTAASVTTPFTGGTDLESVEDLRARLLQRTQNPPSSGTASDYVRWALEISGVGRAWALAAEQYAGAGSVGIVIATADLLAVSSGVKTATQTYIDSVRPVGARAVVEDITRVAVVYDISITPDTSDIRTAIDANLRELHLAVAEPGGTLPISRIRSAISSSGVVDYDVTEIYKDSAAQGVGNVVTTGLQVASFESANYSEL